MITRCAVLGSPIAHSLSPALHRAAYAALGLSGWIYEQHEVDDRGLAGFVAALGADWRGLSMTKPLKEAALALGDADDRVRLAGAANTMILERGRRRLFNTDIGGLTAALRSAGVHAPREVVALGAGGTTRAALVSLAALGTRRVSVVARRPEQAAELVPLGQRVGVSVVPVRWDAPVDDADLLISTVGAEAAGAKITELARRSVGFGAVFDVLYDPWPTPLAVAAEAQGWPVINGLDLLAHQAVEQVELMTGSSVPAAVLLSAGRQALRPDEP